MSNLELDVRIGTWIEVRHTADQGTWIPDGILGDPESLTPADVLDYTDAMDLDDVDEIRVHRNAIGVRLSAPGYMDATDWTVVETIEDARRELEDLLDMGDGTDTDGRDVEELARDAIPDDENRVRVEFHRRDEGEDWEREPVAVFPDLAEYPDGSVQSYVRVGQHGAASLAVVRGPGWTETDDDDEETRKLADELERIGYRFARVRTVYVAGEEDEGPDDDDGETSAPDAPPTGGESVCDECGRGLGDDYTDGCGECEDLLAEKRATDAYAELRKVREELGTALGARDDARAELADARTADPAERNPGPVNDAQDRVDMLEERVRELDARADELECVLLELEREPCERCGDVLLGPGESVCLDCAPDDYAEDINALADLGAPPEERGDFGEPGKRRLLPGTLATFTPTATRDATGLDLQTRRGSRVLLVRRLEDGDADLAETGPMFRVRFTDGAETDAFLEELDTRRADGEDPSVVHLLAPGMIARSVCGSTEGTRDSDVNVATCEECLREYLYEASERGDVKP